jgi:hypothetical protein
MPSETEFYWAFLMRFANIRNNVRLFEMLFKNLINLFDHFHFFVINAIAYEHGGIGGG